MVTRSEEASSALAATRANIDALEAQTAQLVEKVKVLVGDAGAGELAGYYDQQSDEHEETATRFLWGAIVFSVLLVGIGWALFLSVSKDADTSWNRLVPELTFRVFVLSVLGYGISFCARSYRANKHLQYSNEHRRNALKTYILFRESTSSEDVQNIITTELVRAVFSPEETGFLDKGDSKTIIEEQSSLLGLLAASKRG